MKDDHKTILWLSLSLSIIIILYILNHTRQDDVIFKTIERWFKYRPTQSDSIPPLRVRFIDSTVRIDAIPISERISVPADSSPQSKFIQPGKLPALSRDTIPPYLYSDPPGGLFYDSFYLHFKSDEPAKIFFRWGPLQPFIQFQDSFLISQPIQVYYYGEDTAGNTTSLETTEYVFDYSKMDICPVGMVPVSTEETTFCIDTYEWPNQKGIFPLSYISLFQARDSCKSRGKDLCTAREWEDACRGPLIWNYPYGTHYKKPACNTHQEQKQESGKMAECRSYFGVYDLSGNVREWTHTKHTEFSRFYLVYGGFWQSQGVSSCGSFQFSFYPENRDPTVGFRCCKEVLEE